MKNRKQSAVSRRLSGSDSEVVFQNLSNSVSTISNILDNVATQTNNNTTNLDQVSQISQATQGLLINQLDPTNAGSLIARIIDLENNPGGGGGGGIDPTDPNQPILVWDNFIVQDNGDPSGGNLTPYPFFGSPRPTGSRFLSPNVIEIYEADSETGHMGVVLCAVPSNGYMAMGNSPGIDLIDWDSFNRMYVILKPVTTTDSYSIEVGLFNDMVAPTKGVYVSGTRGANWVPTAKDSGTTTGTTKAFANDWITIKIEKLSATSAIVQFNDDPEVILTTDIPSGYLVPGIRGLVDPSTFESFDFKLDFFSLKLFSPLGQVMDQSTETIVKRVRNTSGSTITKGQPVKIVGAQGASGLLLVSAATNVNATADNVVGVAMENITNNNNGYVVAQGYLGGLDTSTWGSDGDRLYLGPTSTLTSVRDPAPAHPVKMGWIVNSGTGTSGSMYVYVEHGEHLENLHDVYVDKTTIQNNDTIKWNSTNNRFEQGSSDGVFYGPPNYEETKTFSYDIDDNLEELVWTVNGQTYTQDFYYNLDGTLDYIEWIRGGNTYRKTFTWNLDGTLASAIITEL